MWYSDAIVFGLTGLQYTLAYSFAALTLSLVVGTCLGTLAFLYPAVRLVVAIYTQIWRGLPVLVTLFVVLFIFPLAGVSISGPVAVVLGLSLWGSAYLAEIVLGALQAVPQSQRTAARALGLTAFGTLRYVQFPQAYRRMLPATVNTLVALIHGTSLSMAVGTVDLLEAVRRATAELVFTNGASHAFEIYAGVMVVYFLICYPLSLTARYLEGRAR